MARNPIFQCDVSRLRGVASVCVGRDRGDGSPVYRVAYVSGGGDIGFTSLPIVDGDQANAAALVLGQIFNAEVKLDA